MEWRSDMENAPRDVPFLAENHDGEIWLAKFIRGNLAYRANYRREPRSFKVREIDGEEWMKEDKAFAEANEAWASEWTYWSRLYDFKPRQWAQFTPPPETKP